MNESKQMNKMYSRQCIELGQKYGKKPIEENIEQIYFYTNTNINTNGREN